MVYPTSLKSWGLILERAEYLVFLEKAGLKKDDVIYLTSSAIGNLWNKNYEEQLCKILCNYFIESTLVMPAFNYDFIKTRFYDSKCAKSMCGGISEHFRKLPQVYRSIYSPIHGVSVYGKDAKDLSLLRPKSSFGRESVFEYLINKADRVNVVHLDCSINDGMAFFHCLEERYNVKYRKWVRLDGIVRTENRDEKISIDWFALQNKNNVPNVQKFAHEFELSGCVKVCCINHSRWMIYSLRDYLEFFEPIFKSGVDFTTL